MQTIASGACIVGRITVRDPVKWATYRNAVPATLLPFEGTLIARGHDARVLAGVSDEADMVVIRFPSMEHVEAWYGSPAYQALIPLRDEAGDVVIVAYRL